MFSIFVLILTSITQGYTQEQPTIGDANVESITVEQQVPQFYIFEPCSHFVYIFTLNKVNAWGDRVYFSCWVDTNLVANWSIAFSANVPPGLKNIGRDTNSGILVVHTIMAEFPYMESNGFFYYRMHFYFEEEVFKQGQVRVAADYMTAPTFEGSKLVVYRLLNSKTVGNIETFKFKLVKPK